MVVHLIQREKKQVVAFPSLMFVQRRSPTESVQRRQHPPLAAAGDALAALALIVAAFARPFVRGAVADRRGRRQDVIVLLDRSYSMGYGERWARAQAAARRRAGDSSAAGDRASLVLFGTGAEVVRGDAPTTSAAVRDGHRPRPRRGPKRRATCRRSSWPPAPWPAVDRAAREVVLVSDFQKNGWAAPDDLAAAARHDARRR